MHDIFWGIVGTGFIADTVSLAIQEAEHNQIVAVCGSSLGKAQQFAKKHGIAQAYADAEALISDPNIDAIYISLPNDLHAQWIKQCAKANKSILCEKPFTVNAPEARSAINALSQSSVFCMEALMYKCHPLNLKLIELIADNRIGDIYAIDAHYACDIFDIANPYCSGGILSLGCYPLSLALQVMDTASNNEHTQASIAGAIGTIDPRKNIDMSASLLLNFPSGATANISCSNRLDMSSTFRVSGEKGDIVIPGNPWLPTQNETIEIRSRNGEKEIIHVEASHSVYCYEILEAAKHIRAGETQSPQIPLDYSLKIMEIMDLWRHKIGLVYDIEMALDKHPG